MLVGCPNSHLCSDSPCRVHQRRGAPSLGSCQEMNVTEMFSLACTPLIPGPSSHPSDHTLGGHTRGRTPVTIVPSSHPVTHFW